MCNVADRLSRESDWGQVFNEIARTLLNGDGVLLHCMAGRHRAAGGAVASKAILRVRADRGRLRGAAGSGDGCVDGRSGSHYQSAAGTVKPVGYLATESSHLHLQSIASVQ